MKVLIIYCHPNERSFTAVVKDTVVRTLAKNGIEYRLTDLYREEFNPVMMKAEHQNYLNTETNQDGLESYIQDLLWCETLIFIYPTWWYGLPAMLKGWLDRVLLPGVAFHMPTSNEDIKPGLQHINRLGLFTTGGASRWLTFLMGAPGRRTIMRAVRSLCRFNAKRVCAVHYRMDTSTEDSRTRHLAKVQARLNKLVS